MLDSNQKWQERLAILVQYEKKLSNKGVGLEMCVPRYRLLAAGTPDSNPTGIEGFLIRQSILIRKITFFFFFFFAGVRSIRFGAAGENFDQFALVFRRKLDFLSAKTSKFSPATLGFAVIIFV